MEQDQVSSPQPVPPIRNFHKPLIHIHQKKKQELQFNSLQNKNHNHRKLTKMITWIRVLCNLMKLRHVIQGTQEEWVIMEISDKTWSTREENGKHLKYSCLPNPINSMKREKDITLEDEPSQIHRCPIYYWGRVETQLLKEWSSWIKAEMTLSCGCHWKRTEILLSFLRLHPSTAFWALLLTMMATPFHLRDSCPQ